MQHDDDADTTTAHVTAEVAPTIDVAISSSSSLLPATADDSMSATSAARITDELDGGDDAAIKTRGASISTPQTPRAVSSSSIAMWYQIPGASLSAQITLTLLAALNVANAATAHRTADVDGVYIALSIFTSAAALVYVLLIRHTVQLPSSSDSAYKISSRSKQRFAVAATALRVTILVTALYAATRARTNTSDLLPTITFAVDDALLLTFVAHATLNALIAPCKAATPSTSPAAASIVLVQYALSATAFLNIMVTPASYTAVESSECAPVIALHKFYVAAFVVAAAVTALCTTAIAISDKVVAIQRVLSGVSGRWSVLTMVLALCVVVTLIILVFMSTVLTAVMSLIEADCGAIVAVGWFDVLVIWAACGAGAVTAYDRHAEWLLAFEDVMEAESNQTDDEHRTKYAHHSLSVNSDEDDEEEDGAANGAGTTAG